MRSDHGCALAFLLLMTVLFAAPLVVLIGLFGFDDIPERFRETVPNPGAEFTKYTGLPFPPSATIVEVGDTHGGFHGDGLFFLILDVDPAEVSAWLDQQPPWKQGSWLAGPVPEKLHRLLGVPQPVRAECVELMNSATVSYVAEDFQMSDIPWHNGRVLVLDPESGRVILLWWDF